VKEKDSLPTANRLPWAGDESGSALLGVMILIGILSLTVVNFQSKLSFASKATTGLKQRTTKEIIRRMIIENINCFETERETFGADKFFKMTEKEKCPSSGTVQSPPWLKLRRFTPKGVVRLFESAESGNGIYSVNKYQVRASCSESANTLVVRAIPEDGLDKLTGRTIKWEDDEALIIGSDVDYKACQKPPVQRMDCKAYSACVIEAPKIAEKKSGS
jgi:hypothetical protein